MQHRKQVEQQADTATETKKRDAQLQINAFSAQQRSEKYGACLHAGFSFCRPWTALARRLICGANPTNCWTRSCNGKRRPSGSTASVSFRVNSERVGKVRLDLRESTPTGTVNK